MTRSEVFEGTGATAGGYIWAKIGATNDGRITAADARFVYEAGAFPGALVNLATTTIFAPYDIQNVRSEGYAVLVNKPKVAPYRAPLGPPAGFAGETLIDELAAKLSMDPIEFRLLNAAKEGTRRVTGIPFKKVGYVETLLGRRRYLPELGASNYPMRQAGERMALNMPVQGTTSDIINAAMVQVQKRLEDDGMGSKMLLQVHDELIFETPKEEVEALSEMLREVMPSALDLSVPIKIDLKTGDNWADMQGHSP